MLRTHTCGELRAAHVGQTVTLCGWVDKYRDHGGIVFIDLRDRYGKTQIKFNLADASDIQEVARALRYEDVIQVTARSSPARPTWRTPSWRPARSKSAPSDLAVLNKSKTPAVRAGRPVAAERRAAAQVPLHRPAPAASCSRR